MKRSGDQFLARTRWPHDQDACPIGGDTRYGISQLVHPGRYTNQMLKRSNYVVAVTADVSKGAATNRNLLPTPGVFRVCADPSAQRSRHYRVTKHTIDLRPKDHADRRHKRPGPASTEPGRAPYYTRFVAGCHSPSSVHELANNFVSNPHPTGRSPCRTPPQTTRQREFWPTTPLSQKSTKSLNSEPATAAQWDVDPPMT